MIDKIIKQNNSNDKLLQIFSSLGEEIIFATGERFAILRNCK